MIIWYAYDVLYIFKLHVFVISNLWMIAMISISFVFEFLYFFFNGLIDKCILYAHKYVNLIIT